MSDKASLSGDPRRPHESIAYREPDVENEATKMDWYLMGASLLGFVGMFLKIRELSVISLSLICASFFHHGKEADAKQLMIPGMMACSALFQVVLTNHYKRTGKYDESAPDIVQ